MKNERWQQVEQLYHAALEKKDDERSVFLDEACAGDETLRREVESLLSYEKDANNFIESPALELAAKMVADQQSTTTRLGQMINQYKVISRIGAGGMGEVYLAEDTSLKRKVALKFLPLVLTQDKTHLRRFEQEARAVAGLSHPNVCIIHEVTATEDGRHCIVMEYIEGKTLREQLQGSPLPINDTVDIAVQIASALSSAHASGVVHRDIKPENVMVRRDGYVKVLDFGLAKLTKPDVVDSKNETLAIDVNTSPGVMMGTVSYMSPEQARGLKIDARSDIWSLGVLVYEMITGFKPFDGPTVTDIIISIVQREPDPLSKYAPQAVSLQPIVTKALAKDPNARHKTADEILGELKDLKRELDRGVDFERYGRSVPEVKRTMILSRFMMLIALVVLLAIAGVVSSLLWRRGTQSTVPVSQIKSLAVLPMLNISGDPSQDYFAEGMTETLISGLAKVTSLRVTSRTSVMQFKGSPKPVKEIAGALGVDALVEGSVQRFGDKIHVDVKLIHGATDQTLWTGTYDRDLRDVLAFQNEVASAVANAIQIKLTPEEESRLAKARSINPTVYDEFLRGRFYLNRQTEADNQTAIQSLEHVVEIDPGFAAGWAELAQAYVWKLFLFAPDEKDLQEKAFVAVQKALALDSELPEAYLARGRLLWTPSNHFPHEQAIQEYRRALSLNPSLDEARNQLAVVLGHTGLLEEAQDELNKALAANPSNNLARFRLGEILLFQGKHEEALTALHNVPPEINPSLVGYQSVLSLFNLGRKKEAQEELDKFLKEFPDDNRGLFTSLQAMFEASEGHVQLAEEKIQLAIERGKGFGHFHHTAYHIACAYALMNKREQGMKWLESAADNGFPCYELFLNDRNLDNLRRDPRFIDLMTRLKQQWEHYKVVLG